MRTLVTAAVLCLAMAPVAAPATAGGVNRDWSIARQWDEETLQAIRLATPRVPVHARTLHHVAAAMYDGWATYDPVAHGVFVVEKHDVADRATARRETISYAAYRVLKARFVTGNGPYIAQIQADLASLFAELGYDASFTSTIGDSPAAIGNRIAAAVLAAGLVDGANEQNNYAGVPPYVPENGPIGVLFDGPGASLNGLWQPIAFEALMLANGNIIPIALQTFTGPHWGGVTPFAIGAADRDPLTGIYFDQGAPPAFATPEGTAALQAAAIEILQLSASLDSTLPATIDVSPGVHHNSPLGTTRHLGYPRNPVTGEAYAPNEMLLADYRRAAAAYWLDGPFSGTPAGHWHSIANTVADTKGFVLRIGGAGTRVDRLEWDVKVYLALGGAAHDAAIAAWSAKREDEAPRPISVVRILGDRGQSSDPRGPSYDPEGLPLVPDLVHVVTPEDVAPGGPLEDLVELTSDGALTGLITIDDHVGDVVVRTWLDGRQAGALGIALVDATAALPGHAYRDDSGWHAGGFELGAADSPGALNPGASAPRGVQLSEVRVGQPGLDRDEYVEITGPPGTDLSGAWLVVIGDVPAIPFPPTSNGFVVVAVDLDGHAIGPSGVMVVGDATLTLATPDVVAPLHVREAANCTYALITGFTGQVGDELEWFDTGYLEIEPWRSVIDTVALRRKTDTDGGIYLDAPVVGPDDTTSQRLGVGWQLVARWMPFQPRNVISPSSPAFIADSSTIARACAEALAGITGSPYFPGGLATALVAPGELVIEAGPSAPVELQWASYFDAADESGESRTWAGVQLPHDDLPGRIVGAALRARAVARARALFGGLAHAPDVNGDGVVDGADLGMLLSAWGPGTGPADLDGDGDVDGADLGALLAAWTAAEGGL